MGGYRPPAPDGMEVLQRDLRAICVRLAEFETPTGTSVYSVSQQAIELARLSVMPVTIYRLDSPLVSASIDEFAQSSSAVPDGHTPGLVSITAAACVKSEQVSGWTNIVVSAGIKATARSTMRNSVPVGLFGSAATTASAVLTDLEAGDPIDVSAFVAFSSAYTVPSVSASGSVLFLC